MPLSYLFWVIYIFSILIAFWLYHEPNEIWYRHAGGYVILWILVGILGYRVFGSAVK